MTISKILPLFKWAILCSDIIWLILCEYAPEEPSTLLVKVDALYYWAKLSDDCFCSKICLLYSLRTGCAAHAVTAIIRNKSD